jgi:serine/threonine-protein kinase
VRPGLPGPLLLDGRYLFLRLLGTGGMGSVFEARHIVLDRLVAVKVLHLADDAAAQSRFRVEAQALGRLDHPGIVKVIDFGVEVLGRGIPYLVMERLEGETLEARRVRRGRLSPQRRSPSSRPWLPPSTRPTATESSTVT